MVRASSAGALRPSRGSGVGLLPPRFTDAAAGGDFSCELVTGTDINWMNFVGEKAFSRNIAILRPSAWANNKDGSFRVILPLDCIVVEECKGRAYQAFQQRSLGSAARQYADFEKASQ